MPRTRREASHSRLFLGMLVAVTALSMLALAGMHLTEAPAKVNSVLDGAAPPPVLPLPVGIGTGLVPLPAAVDAGAGAGTGTAVSAPAGPEGPQIPPEELDLRQAEANPRLQLQKALLLRLGGPEAVEEAEQLAKRQLQQLRCRSAQLPVDVY